MNGLLSIDLPGVDKLRSGKVREVFDLGNRLLIVATDRISAFDVILPDAIPGKGEVLTQLSVFWFHKTQVPNHFITSDVAEFPPALHQFSDLLQGRSMLVRKTDPLPIEWVVRGYLAGSAWKEYEATGTVSGVRLPANLRQAAKLPEVILTPATKSEHGHDQNVSLEECRKIVGDEATEQACELSLDIYRQGSLFARERGIIIADTKFEFGVTNGSVILIDECLTPDSSRFWPADRYTSGDSPPSFDKQIVRDYLEQTGWNKTPPGPKLPDEIIAQTSLKYREALDRLTLP